MAGLVLEQREANAGDSQRAAHGGLYGGAVQVRCRKMESQEALKQRVSKGLDREWLRVFEELRDFFYFIYWVL